MIRAAAGRVYNQYRDGGHALPEFVVPESAPGRPGRQTDGGAGSVCASWRRIACIFGDGVAGKLERVAGVAESIWSLETAAREPKQAVEDALELLHEDYAYEFQIGWSLWEFEPATAGLDARWTREPRLVRVTGYGPLFDEAAYELDGHIRIDFGSDAAFLDEELDLDSTTARHVEENVRQLVSLTTAVEKESGATARLLWSELGESLAQRLAARLGMTN